MIVKMVIIFIIFIVILTVMMMTATMLIMSTGSLTIPCFSSQVQHDHHHYNFDHCQHDDHHHHCVDHYFDHCHCQSLIIMMVNLISSWSLREQCGDGDFDVDYGDLVDNNAEDAENFNTNYGFKSERAGGRWLPFKKEKSMMDLGGHRRALLQFEMRNPAMFLMGALLIIGMKIARIL